jgi:ribosomal protein S12 methylthiotransferase
MTRRDTPRKPKARRRLRVGLVSLGCPKNLVDSEVMLGHLRRDGCEIVAEAAQADVILVNTCAFIEQAKRESVETILEMAQHKRQGRAQRLVVTGCMVQRYGADLRREIPEIDALAGPDQVRQIVGTVRGTRVPHLPAHAPVWIYDHASPRVLATPPYMAYAKIAEGCNYACSFCAIPGLRGRYRSRTIDDVVSEAQRLAGRGVKELILIAQDTSRYGQDRGLENGLARLLRKLGRVDGLHWIRVMYAHPTTLNDAVLDAMAEEPKVVKYLDVPLQHASASVLRRMHRPSARRHVIGLVERLRRRIPGVALRTTLIVGFPGETAAELDELLRFVREGQFEHLGAFAYSREEGTAAFDLPGQVPVRVAQARLRRVMELQRRVSLRRNQARVGERLEVLVEAAVRDGEVVLRGRSAGQAPEIDGSTLITEGQARAGDFVMCEVTGALDYDLVARIA